MFHTNGKYNILKLQESNVSVWAFTIPKKVGRYGECDLSDEYQSATGSSQDIGLLIYFSDFLH